MEELYNETQSAPQQNPNPAEKGNKKIPVILIIICAVFLIVVSLLLLFFTNYQKNKSFKNGIVGTYICTDALVTMGGREAGWSYSDANYFEGLTMTVTNDGRVTDFLKDSYQLEYVDDFFSLDKNYLSYHSSKRGSSRLYIGSASFSKKGSQRGMEDGKPDLFDVDTIDLYLCDDDVTGNYVDSKIAFALTFEKLD